MRPRTGGRRYYRAYSSSGSSSSIGPYRLHSGSSIGRSRYRTSCASHLRPHSSGCRNGYARTNHPMRLSYCR